ncbi:MAG TPA: hypothetical protein VLG49_00385 [Rhabdochlamydiaceae bacterium]|nr:hypothetical protein [Rhabdochlamydiaceae bacterium]
MSANHNPSCAVTYEFSGGRLGDNIITYMHAKWISFQYGMPLLYKPFKYSDHFILDQEEPRYNPNDASRYRRVVRLGRGATVTNNNDATLYIVPYFPESDSERRFFKDGDGNQFPHFFVDWKNPDFRQVILHVLQPKQTVALCEVPKDKITVAVHVRKGGGYDTDDYMFIQPLKIPPESFYLEQLQNLCNMFPEQNMHIHLFTDDRNPEAIANRFKTFLNQDRIVFSYRNSGNFHDSNVLEDLFSMLQFDCLIRPESSFSIIPSLLKDYDLLIHPDNFVKINNYPYIDRVKISGKFIP